MAIEELAGRAVIVPYSRIVGVFNPRVLVIDTATSLRPVPGLRARVVVLIESGALKVPASAVVGSTVRVVGTARTLLGAQISGEVAWPRELDRELIERLEVRAAILARSVQTAEGVELTAAAAAP